MSESISSRGRNRSKTENGASSRERTIKWSELSAREWAEVSRGFGFVIILASQILGVALPLTTGKSLEEHLPKALSESPEEFNARFRAWWHKGDDGKKHVKLELRTPTETITVPPMQPITIEMPEWKVEIVPPPKAEEDQFASPRIIATKRRPPHEGDDWKTRVFENN